MCQRLRPYMHMHNMCMHMCMSCACACACCRPPRLGQRGADQDRCRQGRGWSFVTAEGQIHAATQLRRFRVDPGGRCFQAEYKVTIRRLQAGRQAVHEVRRGARGTGHGGAGAGGGPPSPMCGGLWALGSGPRVGGRRGQRGVTRYTHADAWSCMSMWRRRSGIPMQAMNAGLGVGIWIEWRQGQCVGYILL